MKVISLSKKLSTPHLMEVLNNLMDSAKINIHQLAKNTGLANTTIKRMCTDPDCNPTLTSINKIAEFFGITPNQLIGAVPLSNKEPGYCPSFEKWEKVPIISYNSVLDWPNNIEEIKESANLKYVLTDIDINEKVFAIIATDESLEPKFSEGTILIFDPLRAPKNKDYAILLNEEKDLPQIRQIFIDGSDIYIKTINPEFSQGLPSKLNTSKSRIIGVLLQAKSTYV